MGQKVRLPKLNEGYLTQNLAVTYFKREQTKYICITIYTEFCFHLHISVVKAIVDSLNHPLDPEPAKREKNTQLQENTLAV